MHHDCDLSHYEYALALETEEAEGGRLRRISYYFFRSKAPIVLRRKDEIGKGRVELITQ